MAVFALDVRSVFSGLTVFVIVCVCIVYNTNTQINVFPSPIIWTPSNLDSEVEFRRNKTFSIGMYNKDILSRIKVQVNWTSCPYKNCIIANEQDIQNQTALLIVLPYMACILEKPLRVLSRRNPDQIWVVMWRESPVNQCTSPSKWNKKWDNMVNWTMSYTYDADIILPYGLLHERIAPYKNYSEMFHDKTHMAAWVVSNCKTSSKRDLYVKELQKHGVQVDIFGRCTGKRVNQTEIRNKISNRYKFYLAFENSFCTDYITEKFYSYFQLDVILVVRGGGNYSRLLSSNAYINAADFPSAKELARFMLSVARNETLFGQYMRSKDKYESSLTPWSESFCCLCQKLNNVDQNRRVYSKVYNDIHNNKCVAPDDIFW